MRRAISDCSSGSSCASAPCCDVQENMQDSSLEATRKLHPTLMHYPESGFKRPVVAPATR